MIACLLALSAAPADKPNGPTAFVHFNLLPMTRKVALHDQTVIVSNGLIVSVGSSRRAKIPAHAFVVDGHRRQFLLPGLADMHTHLRYESDLALYLANGVTTARNMRGHPRDLEWQRRVAEGALDGPRIYTAGPILGLDPGHVHLETPEAGDKEVRKEKAEGYDYIKVYDELPARVLKQVVDTAKLVGIPVVGHINQQLGVKGVLALHQYSLEHAEQFAYHWFPKYDRSKIPALIAATPTMAKLTKQAGSWVCPTMAYIADLGQVAIDSRPLLARPEVDYLHPESYIWWATTTKPKEAFAENRSLDQFQDHLLRALHRAGVGLLVGTDTYIIGSVMGFSLHREMKRMAKAGLSPYEVLKAATANAGVFTHGNFGVVKRGAVADLIVVDRNPLQSLSALDRIEGVMNRGRWHSRGDIEAMLVRVRGEYAPGLKFVKLVLGRRTDEALRLFGEWRASGKTPIFDQGIIFGYLSGVLKGQKRDRESEQIAALSHG